MLWFALRVVHVCDTAVAADQRCDKDEFANSNNCAKPTRLPERRTIVTIIVVVTVVINARVTVYYRCDEKYCNVIQGVSGGFEKY